MLQNDEALYYGKPHHHYITPKTLVIIGVVSIYVKVIILFLLLVANLIRGCTPKPNCPWLYPQLSLTFLFAWVYWLLLCHLNKTDFFSCPSVLEIYEPICTIQKHSKTKFRYAKQIKNIVVFRPLVRKLFSASIKKIPNISIVENHLNAI